MNKSEEVLVHMIQVAKEWVCCSQIEIRSITPHNTAVAHRRNYFFFSYMYSLIFVAPSSEPAEIKKFFTI